MSILDFLYSNKNTKTNTEITLYVRNVLSKCHAYVKIINSAINANQFFKTFELFINELKSIIPLENKISLSGEKPSKALNRILIEREEITNKFIERSANYLKNELSRFSTLESKNRYILLRKNEILQYTNYLTQNNINELNHYYSENYLQDLIGGYSNETWHQSYANNIKYHSVLKAHSEYLEKIDMLYTIANNLTVSDSPQMQQVITLCLNDIKLAPQLKEYYITNNKIFNNEYSLPIYPTFKRLAIIYEKQKEYQKAIEICNYAIELGFYKDGTAGQLPGRLARLIKKAGNTNSKIDKTTN